MQYSSNVVELLKKLSNAHGISGYEDEIREIIKDELKDFVDKIEIDPLGNIFCVKKGDSDYKIMLAAHMDEIGFMVKYIDDKGYLRIVPIGGWFEQTVLSQRVILHGSKGKVYGVIGCKPPHLMKDEERKKVIKIEDMFVDIGASSKDEVLEMGVNIGTPVTIDRKVVILGKNKITGKAFDDRVGIAVMIEALKQTKSNATIYAVGTVQEEVGLKGARTSAFAISPNVAIAIDVCTATDHPGTESAYLDIKLGNGPAIAIAESSGRGLITTKKVFEWLKRTAEENKIPYQLEVTERGMSDAAIIYLTKSGIPTGTISVPARYIHTPVEVIDIRDLENSVALTARAMETAEKYLSH